MWAIVQGTLLCSMCSTLPCRNLHVASLELTKGIAGCQSPVASPQAVPLNLTHAVFDATGEVRRQRLSKRPFHEQMIEEFVMGAALCSALQLLVTVEQGSAFSSNSTSVLKIWKCLEQVFCVNPTFFSTCTPVPISCLRVDIRSPAILLHLQDRVAVLFGESRYLLHSTS